MNNKTCNRVILLGIILFIGLETIGLGFVLGQVVAKRAYTKKTGIVRNITSEAEDKNVTNKASMEFKVLDLWRTF